MQEWFNTRLAPAPSKKPTKLAEALGGLTSRKCCDFTNFDGNPQTIRLVAHLQMLADYSGLNLTAGTLSALMKYTAHSDAIDSEEYETRKTGYFLSEDGLVEEVRQATGTGNARNPIAFLVEAADDIVYSLVDIEDGVKKGVLSWQEVRERLLHEARDSADIEELLDRSEARIEDGVIEYSSISSADAARVQMFRTYVIGSHVAAVTDVFLKNYDDIMSGELHLPLVNLASSKDILKGCKRLGRDRIYCADSILELEVMGRKVIHDLSDLFWEAVGSADPDGANLEGVQEKLFALMSRNYRMVFRRNAETIGLEYARLQLIADWLSGMTDSFATRLHKRLMNGE